MNFFKKPAFGKCAAILTVWICGLFSGSAQTNVNSMEKIQALTGTIFISRPADSIGSGFVFGPRRELVTCDHVVEYAMSQGQLTNMFLMINRKTVKLNLKTRLPKFDLAVFTSDSEIPGESFKVGDFKNIRPGEFVVYSGYDRQSVSTNSAQQTVTVVSLVHTAQVIGAGSAMYDGHTVDFLEFRGEGVPGYSGGPVFNETGELVGILSEAIIEQGVKGGPVVLVNRAFSLDPLISKPNMSETEKNVAPK
jgi:S1-C subfamily serine protease